MERLTLHFYSLTELLTKVSFTFQVGLLEIENTGRTNKLQVDSSSIQFGSMCADKNGIKTPQPQRNIDGNLYSLKKLPQSDCKGKFKLRELNKYKLVFP